MLLAVFTLLVSLPHLSLRRSHLSQLQYLLTVISLLCKSTFLLPIIVSRFSLLLALPAMPPTSLDHLLLCCTLLGS